MMETMLGETERSGSLQDISHGVERVYRLNPGFRTIEGDCHRFTRR